MTAAVNSTAGWEDANAVSPPADAISATAPQYQSVVASGTTKPALIYIGGATLPNNLYIPWTYDPKTFDNGASISASINSGSTWTTTVLAPAGNGVIVRGTMIVPLGGATVVIIQVSSP
jgi:hypothetical protein